MKKQPTKVELDGKIIFTKPMFKEDNLLSIRESIKDRIETSFIFLDQEGNPIDKNDENDFTLEDIIEGKKIKLKSEEGEGGNNSKNNIKVFLGDKNFCSINCDKIDNLNKARKLIKDKCKEDFFFLDTEENIIEPTDENDFTIDDILINEVIKIKLKDSSAPTPIINNNNIPKKKEEKKKEEKKKIVKKIDFSQFKILEKKKNLTFYKYSNLERVSKQPLVYQYFYDKFNAKDYSDAYIVLFCGKTGDGKSTAINAFFNIIKGVQLKDDYRFILITEPKKDQGQAVSQTDGLHLYYLKDYNNKPLIIIDSQGYGDTRGKKYDEMVNDAFKYVFSEVIDHINTVCFISKANTNRLDILTRYIFSSVTSLFSEDITENFLIVATFASKGTIENGPDFIQSIQADAEFLKIQDRLNEKWWYAFDSTYVLDNEEDRLTKYSIQQLTELYEEKIKKLRPKNVKKCAEVLATREELKIQVNILSDTFENLIMEQANLQNKEKVINDISLKIKDMETRISNFERDAARLDPKELEKRLELLNQELDSKLNDLNNQTVTKHINSCEYYSSNSYFTHCDKCERNCHDFCDCIGSSLGRCKVFSYGYLLLFDKVCGECKCPKDAHQMDHYRWTKKIVNTTVDNSAQKKEVTEQTNKEKEKYSKELENKKKAKNNLDKQIDELNDNKNKLNQEKMNNINERNEIQKKIIQIKNQITFIIVKLKNISKKIDLMAMNNNHLKTEEEYINSLEDNMKEAGIGDEEQKRFLKEQKENIKIFKETNKLDEEYLLNISDSDLASRLNAIIPKSKKEK